MVLFAKILSENLRCKKSDSLFYSPGSGYFDNVLFACVRACARC
jgi:hypothetical protein